MTNVNPWLDMPTPQAGKLSSKLVNSQSPNEFRWVKDESNRIGLALIFKKNVDVPIDWPNLNNATAGIQPDGKTFTIFLKDIELVSQFRIFCEDCANTVDKQAPGDIASTLTVLTAVISRWQRLFDGSFKKSLSKTAEIGLIGELLVLKTILMEAISPSDAVLAWNGPKGHEQDFSYNGSLLEVKCQLSSRDRVVNIASLEQLDGVSGQIYLAHLGISNSSEMAGDAFSLPSLVESVLVQLVGDNYATDTFLGSLQQAGYQHGEEKVFETYVQSFAYLFKVSETFPKIIRRQVPSPIERCSYKLNTAQLHEWEISKDDLLSEVLQ